MSATPQTQSIPTLLKEVFGKSEIAYLIEKPRFRAALSKALEGKGFDGLRQTALDLLSQRDAANQSVQPLPQDSKRDRQSPLPSQA